MYTCTKYLVPFIFILKFVSNFTNTIVIIESRYGANEISKCFVEKERFLQVHECFRELLYVCTGIFSAKRLIYSKYSKKISILYSTGTKRIFANKWILSGG